MKRTISALCAIVVLLSFVACTNKKGQPSPSAINQASESATKTICVPLPTIACIYAELTGDFWGIAANGANAALEELKASGKISGDSYLVAPSTTRDVEQQKALIDDAMSKKVDGIVLSAVNVDEISVYFDEHMQNLADGGIPIIAIDRSLTVPESFDCVVTTMIADVGGMSEECGKLAVEALGGKGEYAYIEIDPKSSGQRNRYWQAFEWLDENAPDLKRMDIADDGIFWASPAGGTEAIKPFIQNELLENIDKNKDIVILTATEFYAIEVCNALKESNIKRTGKTMVIGFDFSQEMYELIKTGEVYGTVGQNPYAMGYESVNIMMAYFTDNKKPEEFTYVPFTVIKQNNLESDEVQAYLKTMEIIF